MSKLKKIHNEHQKLSLLFICIIGKNFPSHKEDWKIFELNNKSVAPNILFVPYNTKEIRHP